MLEPAAQGSAQQWATQARAALEGLSAPARAATVRVWHSFQPAEQLSLVEWPERYRHLAGGHRPGPFRWDAQPALRGIAEALDDPAVREIVCQKSSQIGYTQSIAMNQILRNIHQQPMPMLVLFGKDSAAKRFTREKLDPAITSVPQVAERCPVHKRSSDSTLDYKSFPGGYLQLVGSNSPGNIKSSDVPIVIVEEPDDVGKDVKGQGNAIAMGKSRAKTFHNRKVLIGGTPTYEGFSTITAEMDLTDKRRYLVRCPHCRTAQTLSFDQVRWDSDALDHHPVYGTHRYDTSRYQCEACPAEWSDAEKAAAIRAAASDPAAGWQATAAGSGAVAGFYLSELLSVFSESRLSELVRRYLEAVHAQKNRGDDSLMREFRNGTLGEEFRVTGGVPDVDKLAERGLDYALGSVPAGGLVSIVTVDVQRGGERSGEARLEYCVRCHGREEQSWLADYGAVLGNPLEPKTWDGLDAVLAKPVRNAAGGEILPALVSIDAGDGMTSDAVYRYVRSKRGGRVRYLATKGDGKFGREIYSPPGRSVDVNAMDKAARYGLRVHLIGTEKAKDLLAGRLKLGGHGPGRIHWPRAVGEGYLRMLTSEAKVPGRGGKPRWTCKTGERNEAWDLEAMQLHGARALRLHTWTEAEWARIEQHVRQPDLLTPTPGPAPVPQPRKAPSSSNHPFGSDDWRL